MRVRRKSRGRVKERRTERWRVRGESGRESNGVRQGTE